MDRPEAKPPRLESSGLRLVLKLIVYLLSSKNAMSIMMPESFADTHRCPSLLTLSAISSTDSGFGIIRTSSQPRLYGKTIVPKQKRTCRAPDQKSAKIQTRM